MTADSPVEIIRRFHATRRFEGRADLVARTAEVTGLYRTINDAEVAALVDDVLASSEEGRIEHEFLGRFVCLRPEALAPHRGRLLDAGVFYPPHIYADARPAIAQRLVELVESATSESRTRNHLLTCLAWTRGNVAVEAFQRWQAAPPDWANELYVAASRYALEAGWELTAASEFRDLVFHHAVPLVAPESGTATTGVEVGVPVDGECHWGHGHLSTLLSIDPTAPALSHLSIDEPIEVLSCTVCACFGQVHVGRGAEGARIQPDAERPKHLPEANDDWMPFPVRPLVASSVARSPLEAASWMNEGVSFSQVGGFPTWIQGAEYPGCLDCGETMAFLAQVSMDDTDEFGEGIYYAFLCSPCRTVATAYQQS